MSLKKGYKNQKLHKILLFKQYFITSKAESMLSESNEIKIEVNKATGKKCERCWKILEKKCGRAECPIL